jgi:hypothetical protein
MLEVVEGYHRRGDENFSSILRKKVRGRCVLR